MKSFSKYFRVWKTMAKGAISLAFNSRIGAAMFLVGKILRFSFFLYFLSLLVSNTKTLAGYTQVQVVFFYLTFNFLDIAAQFLFRGVYVFRPLIISGNFDFDLLKPINPLFRALMGRIDILDFITLIPLTILLAYLSTQLSHSLINVVFYWLLVMNGLLIAFAFHMFVIGLAIVTLEIDHAVMIYRDLTSMGKIPIDAYKEPVKTVLNLILVGIMMTLPTKFLIGFSSPAIAIISLIIGAMTVLLSRKYWNYALTKYASASS